MLESSFTNVSTNSPVVISQSYVNYNRRDSACARDELISSKNLEDNGFQHKVLRRLAQITLQMSEISKKLDAVNGTRMKDVEGEILIQFDDIDALYEFDRKLGADKRVFKKFLISYLPLAVTMVKKCCKHDKQATKKFLHFFEQC
ncbi:uncharacterized protein LOC105849036 [Hydra vulgaris]|uniref:uncharacterized protein LOC105849036 n=1 Tax=Hydra vulgaris TaxID=6087 RepID=UPI001F5F9F35|nr:uncharacterized protein LOC105849036 isoform X2 [Hydra vulgaris]